MGQVLHIDGRFADLVKQGIKIHTYQTINKLKAEHPDLKFLGIKRINKCQYYIFITMYSLPVVFNGMRVQENREKILPKMGFKNQAHFDKVFKL